MAAVTDPEVGPIVAADIARARLPRTPVARLVAWLREPFVVGPDECPIMHRWAVIGGASPTSKPLVFPGFKRWTVKVHHFLPNADDRNVHDHPWPFVTVGLRGSYDDHVPCRCVSPGATRGGGPWLRCPNCRGTGLVVGDSVRAGSIRYRGPDHKHITRSGPRGAWTLVITGNRLDRPWGFFVDGVKWRWDRYIETFGESVRCD